jgi:hypothetical protein
MKEFGQGTANPCPRHITNENVELASHLIHDILGFSKFGWRGHTRFVKFEFPEHLVLHRMQRVSTSSIPSNSLMIRHNVSWDLPPCLSTMRKQATWQYCQHNSFGLGSFSAMRNVHYDSHSLFNQYIHYIYYLHYYLYTNYFTNK